MHIIPAHKGMLWKKNTHVFTFSLVTLWIYGRLLKSGIHTQ